MSYNRCGRRRSFHQQFSLFQVEINKLLSAPGGPFGGLVGSHLLRMLWAGLQTLNSPQRITDRPRFRGPSGGDKRLRSAGKDLHESTDDPAKSESDSNYFNQIRIRQDMNEEPGAKLGKKNCARLMYHYKQQAFIHSQRCLQYRPPLSRRRNRRYSAEWIPFSEPHRPHNGRI